jgi:hypothetical protein
VRGGEVVVVREFKEDTGFCQRIWAVKQAFAQRADLSGEKSVEMPNFADPVIEGYGYHKSIPFRLLASSLFDIIYKLLAFVK